MCERLCVTTLYAKDCVRDKFVCGRLCVCDKAVCERLCVTKLYVKDCVCVCVTKLYVKDYV